MDLAQFSIVIKSFNYRVNYGYELGPFNKPMVATPTTDRAMISMLGALATHTGSIVNGLSDIGKKETIMVSRGRAVNQFVTTIYILEIL